MGKRAMPLQRAHTQGNCLKWSPRRWASNASTPRNSFWNSHCGQSLLCYVSYGGSGGTMERRQVTVALAIGHNGVIGTNILSVVCVSGQRTWLVCLSPSTSLSVATPALSSHHRISELRLKKTISGNI